MPYHRQHQHILLDEGALENALKKKGKLRGGDGSIDHNNELGTRSPVRRTTYLLEPQTTKKRSLGSGMILLDENRLEQALKAKAERRKAAQDSIERRRQAHRSLDRLIDSDVELPAIKDKSPKPLSKRRISPMSKEIKLLRAAGAEVEVLIPTSVHGDASSRSGDKMIFKKKKTVGGIKKKRPENVSTNVKSGSSSMVVSASYSGQASRPPLPPVAVKSTEAPKSARQLRKQPSGRPPTHSASKGIPPEKIGNTKPPSPVRHPSTKNLVENQLHNGKSKRPSKQSIATASTMKRSADSVSTLEDLSDIVNASDHSRPKPTSLRSQPSSFLKPSSATARSRPKTSFQLPQGSDHSVEPTSSHSQPGSYRNQQPPSWSVRNQTKTGFTPNQYITKETMTHYTENLGGVETVATTTKIFYDKAKYDPELKGFFTSTNWEHVRNEFIILANLEVPESFDENIKGILEHHCKLLENGANMDKLISIWESAIESSWLEHRMDDARQLIVGPSRVIFNLKALERHYAMHLKDLRAAARVAKKKEKSSGGSVFARFRPRELR